MSSLLLRPSDEISAAPQQVDAAVKLLDAGDTVPFIARYRKEATGGLDDGQLRLLAITQSISEQGKMTDALAAEIKAADSKARLEDLYLPYRQKRRTKAQIAREAGLAPLADRLLTDPSQDPEQAAVDYVDSSKNINDTKNVLDGARQIIIENMEEDADLLSELRDFIWNNGIVFSKMAEGASEYGAKFSDYFSYQEKISEIPSHRALALFRGRNENILLLKLEAPDDGGDRDRFVKDPHSIVQAGDLVKVKVLEVDLKRQPVALTMRLAERPAPPRRDEPKLAKTKPPNRTSKPDLGNRALAKPFARARQK